MRFWLDKGADGFRMDVINFVSKDQGFPDVPVKNPRSAWQWADRYYANGPRLHEYLQGLGKILKEYDAFSVGEMPFVKDTNEVLKAVRFDRNEINMIFNFEHVDIDHGTYSKFEPGDWKLTDLKKFFERWQTFMYENGGWNALYWENHDQPRSIDRYTHAKEENRLISSKMLAVALALHGGTPFVYQGQELGMRNVPPEWSLEEYKDIDCLNHWNEYAPSRPASFPSQSDLVTWTNNNRLLKNSPSDTNARTAALQEYQKKSRDNARTPVQWTSAPNGGFTGPNAKPWMSVNPDYARINAEAQVNDPNSTYHFWATVLALRKQYLDIFVYGNYELVDRDSPKIFAFSRGYEGQKALVVCNWTDGAVEWDAARNGVMGIKAVLLDNWERTTETAPRVSGSQWSLKPYEAVVVLL